MTTQRRFSTADLQYTDPAEDCYLDPSDPAFDLLGRISNSQLKISAEQHFSQKHQAQQSGIRPGTPAWYAMTQTNRRR